MKNRTIVLSKEALEHMPSCTHEFKVIKYRAEKGQNFRISEGSIKNINFIISEDGYVRPV